MLKKYWYRYLIFVSYVISIFLHLDNFAHRFYINLEEIFRAICLYWRVPIFDSWSLAKSELVKIVLSLTAQQHTTALFPRSSKFFFLFLCSEAPRRSIGSRLYPALITSLDPE